MLHRKSSLQEWVEIRQKRNQCTLKKRKNPWTQKTVGRGRGGRGDGGLNGDGKNKRQKESNA